MSSFLSQHKNTDFNPITHLKQRRAFNPSGYKYAVNKIIQNSKDFIAYKVTLPANLSGELMFRCNKFDINAATLFPGFDGASKAALEFKLAKKQAKRL